MSTKALRTNGCPQQRSGISVGPGVCREAIRKPLMDTFRLAIRSVGVTIGRNLLFTFIFDAEHPLKELGHSSDAASSAKKPGKANTSMTQTPKRLSGCHSVDSPGNLQH